MIDEKILRKINVFLDSVIYLAQCAKDEAKDDNFSCLPGTLELMQEDLERVVNFVEAEQVKRDDIEVKRINASPEAVEAKKRFDEALEELGRVCTEVLNSCR